MPALPAGALGLRDLRRPAAEMDGSGLQDVRRTPRNRAVEGVVELEHPRPVSPCLQPSSIPGRQHVTGERDELARREVAQDDIARRQFAQRFDLAPGLDLAAQCAQSRRERIRNRLRAAARERPARHVCEQEQHESERCAAAALERQDGVRARTCEEGPDGLGGEPRLGE